MATIGLFFGSTDGATAQIAERIRVLLAEAGHEAECYDVGEFFLEDMADFDHIILGVPTWNVGQLQADWDEVIDEFETLDLRGTDVAVFGLGDQIGYPDTFVDAIFFLADKAQSRGARIVGRWPTAGYQFERSWAVVDGDFVGLALDELNQPELTEPRLRRWLAVILAEMGI